MDADNSARALTDGILNLRFLAGFTGQSLTSGAVNLAGNRTNPEAIEGFLNNQIDALDVDGNGQARSLTDGILVLRYLAGFRGDSLINNAVDADATRTTAEEIEAWLATAVTGNGTASSPVAGSQSFVFLPNDDDIDVFFSSEFTNTRGF